MTTPADWFNVAAPATAVAKPLSRMAKVFAVAILNGAPEITAPVAVPLSVIVPVPLASVVKFSLVPDETTDKAAPPVSAALLTLMPVTAEAVEQFGFDAKMTHVSTGGGAFLAYVEGKKFASLAQIDDK